MSVDLSKHGDRDDRDDRRRERQERHEYRHDQHHRNHGRRPETQEAIDREIARQIDANSQPSRAEAAQVARVDPAALSDKQLEKLDIDVDESRLTPLGVTLPNGKFLSDGTWKVLRGVGLFTWIALYALSGPLQWWFGFIAMWIWIGADRAYDNATKQGRRRRKREMRALRIEALGGPPAQLGGSTPAALPSVTNPPAQPAPETSAAPVAGSVTEAERALLRTVGRVERSEKFERRDVVLVNEIADVLAPLLHKVAQPGSDVRVRHDLETLATEHLPATVDTFLALPADYAREHVTNAGTTPVQELRTQLNLLHDGVIDLRDAVLDADVDRQLTQSRFLESKFRKGDLDL